MSPLNKIEVYDAQIRDIERDIWQLHGEARRKARRAIRYRERRIAELSGEAA